MIQRRWFSIMTALLLFATAAEAQVTPAEKAAAEALFDRGISALREGKLERACESFEQSNAIERGIGTMLYLAECYEKLGRTASAWALFREATSEAQAAGQLERAAAGRERAKRLEPLLSRLTIDVPEEHRLEGLQVERNGIQVPEGAWGVPLPVDPGQHRIEARAVGYEPSVQELTVEKGPGAWRLQVPKLTPAPVAAIDTPAVEASLDTTPPSGGTLPPAPDAPPPRRGLSTTQILGIGMGGAGVVLLAVGAGYGIRAIKKNNAAEDDGCAGDSCTTDAGVALSDDALTASKVANVGVIGGAALLAGGLLTYFLSPKGDTQVAVSFDHQRAAIGVGGVF